jgi:hypothetical protein
MTFTNNFVVSAWIKLTSYAATSIITSRSNSTSGWLFYVSSTGQLYLEGRNAGATNVSNVSSYQSIPLNKWVHVTAQLDMATFTASTTTSYIMIDGVDVPALVARSGTNPTALVQAGNLEIGSYNGGTSLFPGKIAQVAIYNAKVTQATILASIDRTLTGSETSLISAYTFNNSLNDLNANANNLTANGGATANNADSPFGGQANGNISSTLDYGIVQSVSFSTNTTVVVQVSEGNTIPTTGGVSAVNYSSARSPYGFPSSRDKWSLIMFTNNVNVNGTTGITSYQNPAGLKLVVPIGSWSYSGLVGLTLGFGSSAGISSYGDIGTTISALNVNTLSYFYTEGQANINTTHKVQSNELTVSVATNLYIIAATGRATSTTFYISNASILAVNGYL